MNLLAYTGPEPLTLHEVKAQCRVDGEDDDALIGDIIIPAARALAEAKSGCAIRGARYADTVPGNGIVMLSVGGVGAIEAVKLNGVETASTSEVQARRTYVTAAPGAVVTYTAGTDVSKHPGVKAWMLLVCGWMYAQRELLGGSNSEPPPHIAESLLASISTPAGF